MSNLRILKKLDGSVELQSLVATSVGGSCEYWAKVGVDITVEKQPEPPKKSLAQVLYEVEQEALGYHLGWENTYGQIKRIYEDKAKAAISYLEKEGWRKP